MAIFIVRCQKEHGCNTCDRRGTCYKTADLESGRHCARCWRDWGEKCRAPIKVVGDGRVRAAGRRGERFNDDGHDDDEEMRKLFGKLFRTVQPSVVSGLPGALVAAKQAGARAGMVAGGAYAVESGIAATGMIDEPSAGRAMATGVAGAAGAALGAGLTHLVSHVANEQVVRGIAHLERTVGPTMRLPVPAASTQRGLQALGHASSQHRTAAAGSPIEMGAPIETGAPAVETVEMILPPHARPGGPLQFKTADGREFSVSVPQGIQPGDRFLLQVPAVTPVATPQPARDECCAVCFGNYDQAHCKMALGCGHQFCDQCVEQVRRRDNRCPTCRAAIQQQPIRLY